MSITFENLIISETILNPNPLNVFSRMLSLNQNVSYLIKLNEL